MTFDELMQLTSDEILDYLRGQTIVQKNEVNRSRWFGYIATVVKTDLSDARYLEYREGISFGDKGLDELGWEFEPKLVKQVYPVEKTIIVYE
jgi:hypothetical protein